MDIIFGDLQAESPIANIKHCQTCLSVILCAIIKLWWKGKKKEIVLWLIWIADCDNPKRATLSVSMLQYSVSILQYRLYCMYYTHTEGC